MLKHYDVTIEGDHIQWLGEKPKAQTLRAILIIEEEPSPSTQTKRTIPTHLIGKGKTLGDIVSPIVDQEDWECKTSAPSPQTNKPIWEIADEIIATIPEESFGQIPTDAAANLDYYLYGNSPQE